ncbi:sigma-70 family RNA polymerase sigma factor [Lactobacillus sp. ESL0731]|uniref:sigma-70 family RNA polymerase sigma factor n=1 Tax=unclassified Lactobacillus TaxID=2620435 RepID=UPI0023F9BB81|nr:MULTISPECIES: sigma-70 family RNA polymerase sigma factor [unclassified Lactobacillus]WEV50964.1 sigma-70 family RNA polymerase sigma factor [Lactobacillus sp. ESL0700]WEV62095.1 sigma-70 family RNA polymerase sigma factor [Lactobacillus sp. ESL0731]
MKISKEAFMAAWENQRLVRGALKAAHVRQDYTNYDDLLQEGICVYAQMLDQQGSLSPEEVDRRSFRKIIWHTIDQLRKEQKTSERQAELEQAHDLGMMNNWDNYLILEREVAQMSELEQLLFFHNLIAGEPISALAQEARVTRVQLQRIKRQLLAHLRQVLDVQITNL